MTDDAIKMNPRMALSVLTCLVTAAAVPNLTQRVLDTLLDPEGDDYLGLDPERLKELNTGATDATDATDNVDVDALRLKEYLVRVIQEGPIS